MKTRKEKIQFLQGIASGTKTIDDLNTYYHFQMNDTIGLYKDVNSTLKLTFDEITNRFMSDKWKYYTAFFKDQELPFIITLVRIEL